MMVATTIVVLEVVMTVTMILCVDGMVYVGGGGDVLKMW